MNFQESLDYLYGLQLFGVKLGLENMRAMKSRLPQLRDSLQVVHVAGTNGKGSVSVILAEILRQSGLRVGLYTSPHLHCFTERIRINGSPVSRREVSELTVKVRDVAGDLPLTFFEATTIMALLAFHERPVDIAVVETGLGGRLDATNIVDPQLCLITPVSYDHCEYLGDSLKEIATEKAGIIKCDAPVIVGRQDAVVAEVVAAAAERFGAPVLYAGQDFSWQGMQESFSFLLHGDTKLTGLNCSLRGRHQLDNYAQAIAAAMQLRDQGLDISDVAITRAVETVQWPGRMEWWGAERKVLVDVAHNCAGISALAEHLESLQLNNIVLVVGLSGERDPGEVLKPLEKFVSAVYAVPVSYNQVVSPEKIVDWAKIRGYEAYSCDSAIEGFRAASSRAETACPVVLCGSLYLIAELREVFGPERL